MHKTNAEWLKLSQDAFQKSTSYADNNWRKSWETAQALFDSKHPQDSKYHAQSYRYRSKVFRPKSRSIVRKNEATAAAALFSNTDVIAVQPMMKMDPGSIASAQIIKEILQYRLTTPTKAGIPWFLTTIGAYQDALKTGIVCSYQRWEYKSSIVKQKKSGVSADGTPVEVEIDVEVIEKDRPCVDVIPPENVRFDPNAKWQDVVGTSPYLILMIPMFLYQVRQMMDAEDRMGRKWKKFPDAEIKAKGFNGQVDTTRVARIQGREDPVSNIGANPAASDYDVVWVHLNFMQSDDGCVVFYTLSDKEILSEPVPLEEEYWHGHIPVVIGFCVVETHNPAPNGLVGLGEVLQRETNEIANSRLDNVKLVLNKRYYIRRNAQVDVDSLLRNVPGGATMVGDVDRDIKESTWNDITASSYQEQDRLNVDFDDLVGNFASSSVLTNRKLNETVGGMQMMSQGASSLTDYTFLTFKKTWIEPVLQQIVWLIQEYESDTTILALAEEKTGALARLGMDEMTDELMKKALMVHVDAGMGATNPDQKFQKFMGATMAFLQLAQQVPPDANLAEIKQELFGLAGYRDANRFFTGQADPRIERLMQTVQQLQQELQMTKGKLEIGLAQERRERHIDARELAVEMKDIQQSAENQQEKIVGRIERIGTQASAKAQRPRAN